jgi:hypothetical protein
LKVLAEEKHKLSTAPKQPANQHTPRSSSQVERKSKTDKQSASAKAVAKKTRRSAGAVERDAHRRNISAGQKAMAHALIYPEAEKGGRGKKNPSEAKGFSGERLSSARKVLSYSRDLALAVRDGTICFAAHRDFTLAL